MEGFGVSERMDELCNFKVLFRRTVEDLLGQVFVGESKGAPQSKLDECLGESAREALRFTCNQVAQFEVIAEWLAFVKSA